LGCSEDESPGAARADEALLAWPLRHVPEAV
jgi:hypothetical protein